MNQIKPSITSESLSASDLFPGFSTQEAVEKYFAGFPELHTAFRSLYKMFFQTMPQENTDFRSPMTLSFSGFSNLTFIGNGYLNLSFHYHGCTGKTK